MFFVTIAGHIGKDPETRFTPGGQKVTSFTVAVNQRKGKEDFTIWVRVTVWGDRFDKMLTYLKKGSGVIVSGRMNAPSSYTDKEGRSQFSLEVTAEMIEFSPFGRNEKNGEGFSSASYSSSGRNPSSQEETAQVGQFYQAKPQFSQNSPSSQYGQGNSYSQQDDDDLPF